MVVVGEEETDEADEEAGTREVEIKVVKVNAIPTTPLPEPVNYTKNSENLRGHVRIDIHALGETTRTPDQKTTEILWPKLTSK